MTEEYDYVAYSAGTIELILMIICGIQTYRFLSESHRAVTKFKAKKIFHAALCIALLLRGIFFLLSPSMMHGSMETSGKVISILDHIPDVFFFFAYFLLIFFWYQLLIRINFPNGERKRRKKKIATLFSFLVFFLSTLSIVWCFMMCFASDRDSVILDIAASILMASLVLLSGLCFLYVGVSLWRSLQNENLPSYSGKIGVVSTIVTFCFLARSGMQVFSAMETWNDDEISNEYSVDWWVVALYLYSTELFPSFLLLVLLRKLPKWKKTPNPQQTRLLRQNNRSQSPPKDLYQNLDTPTTEQTSILVNS